MKTKIKKFTKKFKNELQVYRLLLKDERTPLVAKCCLGLAVGYVLLPFDLIPDFIPVLGQLDDLVIVPLLVYLAIKIIPRELILEYRAKVNYEL